MNIVADTNTFLAVAFNEPEKDRIIHQSKGCHLIAPDVLPYEIGNALSAMLKKKTLNKKEISSAWKMVQNIPVELKPVDIEKSLTIVSGYVIYAYDAYFLECAVRYRCPLLSLDKRMKTVAQSIGITVMES